MVSSLSRAEFTMILFPHHLLALSIIWASTLGFGLFVLWKNPRRPLHRSMALYCLSVAWWSGWECLALHMPTRTSAYLLMRVEYIGVSFIATLFCATVSFLLDLSPQTRRRFLTPLYLGSVAALLVASVYPTPQFLDITPGPIFYLPFWGIAGPYYSIFLVFFLGELLVGLGMLVFRWSRARGQERTRLALFLVGSSVAFLGACPEFALKYGVRFGWLNPFGLYGMPCYVGLMTYAIVQHHFLDIPIVIRKSAVYSLLIACITASYLVMVLIMEKWFQGFVGYRSVLATTVVAFLIAIFFNPLRNRVQAFVDRALFKATPAELATQRDQLLTEVRKTDQMKAVATFAAGLAHEIKNPLTAIKTFIDYLPEKYDDPVFREKCTRIVGQEVSKINALVHSLLDFAKPRAPQKQATHLSQLLDETLDFLSGDFLKKRIQVTRAYTTEDDVLVDPAQLKQVFLNVALNSIDAMDGQGGKMTVLTARENGHLEVRLTDTGPGIPKETLPHLFEPFYTTKPSGTGLGLSIVQTILHDHGGRINIESQLGQGTTVRMTLPAVPSEQRCGERIGEGVRT